MYNLGLISWHFVYVTVQYTFFWVFPLIKNSKNPFNGVFYICIIGYTFVVLKKLNN